MCLFIIGVLVFYILGCVYSFIKLVKLYSINADKLLAISKKEFRHLDPERAVYRFMLKIQIEIGIGILFSWFGYIGLKNRYNDLAFKEKE